MARPIKNSCDFFSHDAGMRNHVKVKALRHKFSNGYAIWVMLLEYLTGCDGTEFSNDDIQYELLSGDFGVSVTEIRDVVNYCIKLEMLFENNGFIYSQSLNERLASVFEKRGRAKELSQQQLRRNGRFCNSNTDSTVVSVTETPQSKVKEIKEDIYICFLDEVNKCTKRKYKGSASIEKSFNARIKEGATIEDFFKAIKNAVAEPYHKETKFKYLTPEFFTRASKLDAFVNREQEVEPIKTNRDDTW